MFRLLFLDRARSAHIQFFRYFFVGGTAAVVDLVVYTALLHWGVHYIAAAFVGYMVGLAWNHMLCVYWVFESKHNRKKEITMVFLIALGGLLWTEAILYGLVDFFAVDPIVAKIISQIIVLVWNFGMRKVFVFH